MTAREVSVGMCGANLGSGYSPDELDFLKAVDAYKRANRRPFPMWSEVLAVLESLGWRRVAAPGPLPRAVFASDRGGPKSKDGWDARERRAKKRETG